MEKRRIGSWAHRGVVSVEYALLLSFIGVPFVAAMALGGVVFVHDYIDARNRVSHAYP